MLTRNDVIQRTWYFRTYRTIVEFSFQFFLEAPTNEPKRTQTRHNEGRKRPQNEITKRCPIVDSRSTTGHSDAFSIDVSKNYRETNRQFRFASRKDSNMHSRNDKIPRWELTRELAMFATVRLQRKYSKAQLRNLKGELNPPKSTETLRQLLSGVNWQKRFCIADEISNWNLISGILGGCTGGLSVAQKGVKSCR